MVEKLSKVLEGLKNIQFATSTDGTDVSKREKMFYCVFAADVMVSMKTKSMANLSLIIENMINLCDDKDSNVRMVAEESLNRIIMSLSQANMLKVQVELHNIIKKNGSARCLRAALTRLGQLSRYIRPNKGKGHVQMLIPALIEIAKREEESIHETLASSLENIFKVLGVFIEDNVLKGLIKAFLHNLSSKNPVIRRCSASLITTVVQYCRKPLVFNCFVLNSLLDCIVPIREENSPDLILGVLGCLRLLLPTIICVRNEEGISGSFGLRKKQDECILSVDRLIQAFELCLHYTNSKDHNLVASALESLNQILQNPPHQLESFFLSPAGFSRSYIHSTKESRLWSRSGSEISVAYSFPAVDEGSFCDDSDITSELSNFSGGELFDSEQSLAKFKEKASEPKDEAKLVENPFEEKFLGKTGVTQTLEIDSDPESLATSNLVVPINFLMRVETEEKGVEEAELFYSGSNSPEDIYSSSEGERMSFLTNSIDVGSFTDAAVPLIYCARHLTASFLLDGAQSCLKSDRTVRVSIKSLALSCLSAIVKLYPVIMKMSLTKHKTEIGTQEMSDVLLFSDHCDPQIRGNVCVLVGSFINSALVESKNFKLDWLKDDTSKLNSKNLIRIIFKGLQDKSSVCSRQALYAVKLCINRVLFSVLNVKFLPVLEHLLALKFNSYWLVKVKLVEVLSDLPYLCISDLIKSNKYQEEVVDSVLLVLLGDEDARVRLAAAEALVRIIPSMRWEKSIILEYGRGFTEPLKKWLKANNDSSVSCSSCLPFSEIYAPVYEMNWDENAEHSLSLIVAKLTFSLSVPKTKHFLFGYLEALKLLSQKYPTTVYPKSWNCENSSVEKQDCYMKSNLIATVVSLMMTSPISLDLTAFSNATVLLGNLFAGHSVFYLKTSHEMSIGYFKEEHAKLWNNFKSDHVSHLAEQILIHLLKVLNFYSRLIEEITLSSVSESSAAPTAFLPLLSPIKKQEKKSEEKPDDKKAKGFSNCKQMAQYDKLQQMLKNAYTNYKISLDTSAGDKFLDLLESTLYVLSLLLEVATVHETGRCAEEILSYLRSVVTLRPTPAVICVIQLLKSLFGTNLASSWEKIKFPISKIQDSNLFNIFFHFPSESFSDKLRRRINSNSFESESLPGYSRRSEKRLVIKNSDEIWLATYIRLFEPMVVKSLQLYTITGDVELQSNVLRLLNQLVQLRVNYCMLDGKQVFLDFVLKQFELIEHGQVPGVEVLLPQIFKFFILLSYKKQHSKPVMSIPKILQLCDVLMASDQPVQTHCIPALIPVVENVFLSRSLEPSVEEKEQETQREVLFSMLLRLVEFPEVMDLLSLILIKSKAMDEKERWKRWSRQVIDTLLPLISQDRLRIETFEGQSAFAKLMSSLSLNVLRPLNPLLKALFVEPSDHNSQTSLKRWLSKVTVLLESVLFVKEDALLNRLEETCPSVNLGTLLPSESLALTDPFNVKSFFQTFEPSEVVARFLLKVMSTVASKIDNSSSSNMHLQQKLSIFFVSTYHIIKSGTFHKITNSLQNLLVKEQDSLSSICWIFQKLINVYPLLTCQFSYFLTLLNYCDQSYWTEILTKPCTLSEKLVQSSGVISLSDYLCDNLSDIETLRFLLMNAMEELVIFSQEIPVKELLITMLRKPSNLNLILDTIFVKDFESRPSHFVEKLLRLLEVTESRHSGPLLKLIAIKFLKSPRLALSLLANSIACRQVEYLLTLPKEKVLMQIDGDTFKNIVGVFTERKCVKRYSTLWGLLKKFSTQFFDSSIVHLSAVTDFRQAGESVYLGEDWYFAQIKERCCQKGDSVDKVPLLLTKLSFERILEIMSCSDFNIKILKECLFYSQILRRKQQIQENENQSHDSGNDLYKAAKQVLLLKIKEIQKKFNEAREASTEETNGFWVEFRSLIDFSERFWEIAACVTVFLDIGSSDLLEDVNEWAEDIVECVILCLKVLEEDLRQRRLYPRSLEIGLRCCSAVLRSRHTNSLQLTRDNLRSCISSLFYLVTHLVPPCQLSGILREEDLMTVDQSVELKFLLDFVVSRSSEMLLPNYIMSSIRDVVVNLCRVPALNSDVLKVPERCDIQDIDLLKNFISRFSMVGWSGRQQFEEIWVALLSVLGFNTQGDMSVEDNDFIVQASAMAVEGITTLLRKTMLESKSRRLIHYGRDSISMKKICEKLPVIMNVHKMDEFGDKSFQYLDNLEILQREERNFQELLSVEYLWTAVKQISSRIDLYESHSEELREIGLDLPSCIHLLTEVYNQWIYQASSDIKILTSSLKCSLVMSDLFTDIAQFQWLLNFCLRVDEVIIPEDTVILPLVILGCCKAGAIVLPNEEVCEKIKKLMLRSKNVSCKISVIEGLLYLLQSYVVCYAINHTSLPPPGSTFQADEANFVTKIVDIFLPIAIDAAQEFKHKQEPFTDEYERYNWALIFYLLQHYQPSLGNLSKELFNFIISTLFKKNCSDSVTALLIRGSQRLLLTTMVDEHFRDQLSKVSLEILSSKSFSVARNGLQLLSVASFLDKRLKNIGQLVTGQEDPERVMRDMEKINVLFEKLRKSYPKEAEMVGDVLSYVLMDFTASDVLTKVIQEFLSSQQPHQQILAGLLFKVFERAEQSLLEDWVVFSLPSFIQGLPISMSIWTLNCFFVCASREPWLRSLFPLVQSRIRMAEVEDKKLLCLSGSHFFKQLKQENQRKSFVQSFEKAAAIDSVFLDLLSSVS